jgi:hypothetical protein
MEQKTKPIQIKWLAHADLHSFKSMIHMFDMVFEEQAGIGSDDHLIRLLDSTSFLAIAAPVVAAM